MKIAICGSHGVGKTTLMNRIAKAHPDWFFVEEQARKCPYPLNQNSGYQTQRWILENQMLREIECYALDTKQVVVCDRSSIDQEAYVEWLYENNKMQTVHYEMLEKYLSSWDYTYDLVCYIPIEFSVKEDEHRDGSKTYQQQIDDILKDVLWRQTTVITLKGDVEQRFKTFEEAYQRKLRGEI